jgi:hypothetical protein
MSTPVQTDTQEQQVPGSQQQIDYEKRFKDTQAAYTKSQQELKAVKAKLEVLNNLTTPQIQIDATTQAELDDLKFSNPDAWRVKMNSLELEAKQKHQSLLTEAEKAANLQAEMENRAQLLADFNRSHPGMELTDDVIAYDVPPRITKQLENGEIDFGTFLTKVSEFFNAPKVIGSANSVLNQPNLGKVGGGDTPSEGAVTNDIAANYKNIVF